MVMLPRNMISPMVWPSHGTGCIVSGSSTSIASCSGVRTPLAPVRVPPSHRHLRPCLLFAPGTGRAVDLRQPIHMRQFDADPLGALDDHRGRRRAGDLAGDAMADAGAQVVRR